MALPEIVCLCCLYVICVCAIFIVMIFMALKLICHPEARSLGLCLISDGLK